MADDRQYYEQAGAWGGPPESYQVQTRADILSMIPPEAESVLDAGCGDGFITNALPPRLRMVGLDISHEALRHVQKETQAGSITGIPFPDKSFDLVMANDVLEHLPDEDLRLALDQMGRVAGKFVLITVPLNEQLDANMSKCAKCGEAYHVHRHRRSFSERDLLQLSIPGFRPIELRLSGALSAPPADPTLALRHAAGLYRTWANALCPRCGSPKQASVEEDSMMARVLGGLRAKSWATRLAAQGPWNNRSEAIVLFSSSPTPRLAPPNSPSARRDDLLAVRFTNPLQTPEGDFVPGANWPLFAPGPETERDENGIRPSGAGRDGLALVTIVLPQQPEAGDWIELKASGQGETDSIALNALDGLTGRQRLLHEAIVKGADQEFHIAIDRAWWPSRFGWVLELSLRGRAAARSLRLVSATLPHAPVPFMELHAGHNVVGVAKDAVVLSWGFLAGQEGLYPRPALEARASGAALPAQEQVGIPDAATAIEEALDSLRAEGEFLGRRVEAKEKERARAELAYAELQKECAALRGQMKTADGLLKAKEQERARAEALYAAAQRHCADLQVQARAANELLEAREAERARAEEAYDGLRRQYNALEEQRKTLNDLLESREVQRARAEEAYSRLSEQERLLSGRFEAMERDCADLRRNLSETQAALEEREKALKRELKAKEAAQETLRRTADLLETTEEKRSKAEEAYSALQQEHNAARRELEASRARVRSLRGLRGSSREFLRSLRDRLWGPAMPAPKEHYPSPPWTPPQPPAALEEGKTRVLVLSHLFPHPDQRALGPFVLEQVKALRSLRGVDARVMTGRPFWMNQYHWPIPLLRWNAAYFRFHDATEWRELDGVPVKYVPYRVIARFWAHGWSYRQALCRGIEAVYRDFPFQVVHAHTAYLDGSAGAAIARRFNVPLIITEHTSPFEVLTRNPIVRRWTECSLNAAARVICVSAAQKSDVSPHLAVERRARAVVIHNGVDVGLFHPPERWNPDPRSPRLLYVGSYEPRKNVPFLLEAMARIAGQYPGAALTIVGKGHHPGEEEGVLGAMERLGLTKRVFLAGEKSREETARIMREEADLLILPSVAETFGCVLAEAMASGKPVVATRCGGPEEIVTEDFAGRLCASGDVDGMAKALTEVIARLRDFSPRRIREFAAGRFGFEAIADEINRLYLEVLNEA